MEMLSLIKRNLGVFMALSFFLIVLSCTHFGKIFEYDPDEGLYLMRAFMHTKGYALYNQIWMDQPPLLVLMLSLLFKIFGPSVFLARVLTLCFSTLLLWALYQIISKKQGIPSAILAIVLLVFSSYYLSMSVSVTGAIIPISFAVLALYEIQLYQESCDKKFLLLSGAFFALGLSTKLIALLFLPALIWEIALVEKKKILLSFAWWSASLLAVFTCISLAAHVDFYQIWHIYRAGEKVTSSIKIMHFFTFNKDYDYLLIAICAFIFIKKEEIKLLAAPLMTLIAGLIFFSHTPIWHTQRFYLILPVCWLASFSLYRLCGQIKTGKQKALVAVIFISAALGWSLLQIPLKWTNIRVQLFPSDPQASNIIGLINKYNGRSHLLITDRPIFAFYTQMFTDSHLLLLSQKTKSARIITADDFLRTIRDKHPEMILFARFPSLNAAIAKHLPKDYSLEFSNKSDISLYIRKD